MAFTVCPSEGLQNISIKKITVLHKEIGVAMPKSTQTMMVGMITKLIQMQASLHHKHTCTLQLHKDIVMCEMCTVASLTKVLTFTYFTVICLLFIDITLVKLCPVSPTF